MKQLTKREDQIMQIVWRLKKAFIREIKEELEDPKPHYNTVATIVKILEKKGILQSETVGAMKRYSATSNFETYREEYLANIKKTYFGNSFPKMMTFFAQKENLTEEELAEILDIIASNKGQKS